MQKQLTQKEKDELLNEVKKRLNFIMSRIKSIRGIMISTDEGISIISVGDTEKSDLLAPISATYLQLTRMVSGIIEDEVTIIEAHYKNTKVLFFQIGMVIFSIIMGKDADSIIVKELLEKLFVK